MPAMLRPMLTDLDMWSGIVGFAMPPLVAVFVQSAWPAWARAVFAFVVCVAGGGVTAALTGYLHGMSPARSALVVLFSALTFYRLFWHPSTIAPRIEAATNIAEPPARLDSWQRTPDDPDYGRLHRSWPPR